MVGLRTCHSSFASSPRSSYARQEAFLLKQLFLFLFLLLVFFSSPLTQGQVSRTQQNPLSLPTQNRSNTPTSGMLDSEIFSLNFSLDFFTLFPIFKMKMHQLIIFFKIFFFIKCLIFEGLLDWNISSALESVFFFLMGKRGML